MGKHQDNNGVMRYGENLLRRNKRQRRELLAKIIEEVEAAEPYIPISVIITNYGVSHRLLAYWLDQEPDFKEHWEELRALRKEKLQGKVLQHARDGAMRKLAGETVKEERVIYNEATGERRIETYSRYVPPDTRAILYFIEKLDTDFERITAASEKRRVIEFKVVDSGNISTTIAAKEPKLLGDGQSDDGDHSQRPAE